jgi:amino acid adenylation domain-containing protein
MSSNPDPTTNAQQEKRALLEKLLKEKAAGNRDAQRGNGAPASATGTAQNIIQRVDRSQGYFPLSFAQRRIWLLDQLEPGNPAYNISMAIRLKGNLNLYALEESLTEIVRRHETLRTTFTTIDEQPVQIVHPPYPVPLSVMTLEPTSEPEQGTKLQALIAEQTFQRFDLATGPLLLAKLVELDDTDHVFIFTFHHIISDGWSVFVFSQELQTLYQAFASQQASPLADLSTQYVDFAHWQQEWLQGELLESQLAYWKKQLASPLPVLNLPADYPRPRVQTFRGAKETLVLSETLTAALKELSRKEGCTMFMTLLAAFGVLLYRQTGQSDLLIGSPIAGRSRSELENLIGFFLNTLVMRIDLDSGPSFQELLRRVREIALQAYANQDVPFEKLLEELHPERHISRTPIFQVFFNMLNFNDGSVHFGDLKGEYIYQSETEARFDLTLYAKEQNKQLYLSLVYNSDLFSQERMAEMARQMELLLQQIAQGPGQSIVSYSLLTAQARHTLPDPTMELDEPEQVLLPELVSIWARQTPNEIAIEKAGQRWTYKELDEQAELLAGKLIISGVKAGDVVAVCGSRSFSLIASMLGVLKSGGVLLTIDNNLPRQRKQLMLTQASAKALILIDEKRLGQIEWADGLSPHNILILGESVNDTDSTNSISLPVLHGTDPAYIFFTSGTTGVPKGVLGNHKGLSHFLHWQRETFGIRKPDRAAQLTALSFDVVLRDVFLALVSGATLCLPDDNIQMDADRTIRWLQETGITVIHTVPSLAQTWLSSTSGSLNLPELRWIFFAGEPLKDALVEAWRKRVSNGQIVNLYGPTETTMAKCYYQVPAQHSHGIQPVGKPLPQTQALVINKQGELCGIAEPGEIVIRTPFRTFGYINAPEENSKKFVPNPFRQDEHDKVYFTGDQGRFRPDGLLEILGRDDDQIKIRGLRVELGEIESALNSHPAVKQVVVVAWQTQAVDKRLVAYIVPDAVQFPNAHELKGYLQQYLPSYMIPAHFILIDAMPLTPNGKVNRGALPEPDVQALQETAFVAPQTQLQELLAEIWADVLHLEKVGIHDNFFELGGHSLLATQIMSRVRRVLHLELPLRVLFEFPTIAAMAEEIESWQKNNVLDIPPLKPYLHEKPPRLSFSQERMWFIHQLAPESAAYNMYGSLRVEGELNIPAVEQTFNIMIERHAILRTTFDVVDGVPVQIIATQAPITIPLFDLKPLHSSEQDEQVRELIRQNAKQPFDLVNGPLLRILLLELAEEEHIIFVGMHHIISDQWSGGVIMREFSAIYNAICTNTAIPLSELPVQYADYSLWQRDWLKGDILQAKLAYWKKQLEGISVLDLPMDFPRPVMQSSNGAIERLPLSASTIDTVRNLCRQEQITPFMFFLGVFKILLLRYTGQEDVAVGSPIANRNWFEIEPLIGTFVNTVVLRTQLNGNPTFQEFLHYIRDLSLDAFNHQDFPFEKLIEELQPERDMSHSPLVQVLFNVQNAPATMPQLEQSPLLTPLLPETRDAQFDLTLSVTTDIVPGILLTYNTDLFKEDSILRMLGNLETLIQSALTDPSQRILDLQMLTQVEREKQLITWNDTWMEYPQSFCVHQLVEMQAEKTPDSVAVQFKDEQLTYHELNSRANRLAHHLRELGVATETPVGISMERSTEMIVGLLGILKAGGTYIPLDPFFPRDRLAYMLEYSGTNILLTHDQPRAKETAELLTKEGLVMVNLDQDWHSIANHPDDNLPINVDPHNLAYILFTSGSTGKPKGVQIPHRAVVNFLISMQKTPGLTASDRLLAVTTWSFDISVLETFLPLITGACAVVLPGEAVFDGAAMIQHLTEKNISVMQATPATWQMLIDAGWCGDKGLKVLCGGEAMPKDLAHWLTQHVGSVWNMYGPTETTVWSTLCEILPATDVITIGYPIANTRIYILDKNFEPVPVGVAGELYIAGDGVARGYLKQPELTAEKFIPEPFVNQPDACMYRTGDQARYLSDGRIDFLGRADFQVKVRGFRIELGEIETILNGHPAIRQAVVIAREDTPGDKRLVAYLIPETDHETDPGELRRYVREKLPEYMVPSAFMFLDEFPMTPNRKVNRKALPAPDAIHATAERDLILPRTRIEAKLVQIWEDLLKIHPIGIQDNFFELGGHSLLAVHLFSRIKEDFKVNLPLATLFREATIEYLARVIQEQSASETWSSLVEIEPQGQHPPFYCVHGLTGDVLWFRDLAQCLAPDYPFYGLQSRGLDGVQKPLEQIDEMAAHYINEIRALQPRGPYYLGGASFGGTVALEMAQQLMAQGEKVALLVIFDDSPLKVPVDSSNLGKRIGISIRIMRNFPRWLMGFLQMGPSRMTQRIRRKMRVMQKGKNKEQSVPLGQLDAEDLIDFADELAPHRQQLITCNFHALNSYKPKPYAGNVILFRALNRPLFSINDPEIGWQKLAPGHVRTFDISSSHEGMFQKPYVQDLAARLRSCLYEDQS